MTTLRSECRATLAWCLDQEDAFTQRDCYQHFGIHQVAISKNFCRLERLGVLKRAHLEGRQYVFWVENKALAWELVEERPKPKNGYIPVTQRRAEAKKPQATRPSFVFQIGAL